MTTPTRRDFLRSTAGAALALGAGGASRAARAGEHLRRPQPVRAVTAGPNAHFFGYYDKCPWDAAGRYLLGMEIGYCDHQPDPGDALTVGMIDLEDGDRYLPLDRTAAWSWQQGTMLQWLGSAPDREVIYNSVDGDRYVAIVRDVHSGATRHTAPADLRREPGRVEGRHARFRPPEPDPRPATATTPLPEPFADRAAPEDGGHLCDGHEDRRE